MPRAMAIERGTDMEANELRHALGEFTGTVEYHRHFTGLQFTDGVLFLAENAGAHWLVDIVASYQKRAMRDPMLREFQVWRLAVAKDKTAVVTCERDTDDVFLTSSPGIRVLLPTSKTNNPTKGEQMETEARMMEGTVINARTGQEMEEGKFLVRELTPDERERLSSHLAKHEGPTPFGTQRLCISVESDASYGGFYVLVWNEVKVPDHGNPKGD